MPLALHEWVTRHARQCPQATAVVLNEQRLSYGELDALSNRIARALQLTGCRRGDRVCLLMPKSPLAIAGIIGIYKADGIYVPLDPASPAARVLKIIDSCDSRFILAAGSGGQMLEEMLRREQFPAGATIGWLDTATPHWIWPAAFNLDDVRRLPELPLSYANGGNDAAHILYTSGSTGAPKGVVITHANVIHFVEWANRYFGIDCLDRLSAHPPLHFDLSFFDIFGSFAAGAELHLVPPEVMLLPNKLAEWIRRSRLTQWFSVPSVLHYMAGFDVVRENDFPAMKRLLWCGEVFPTRSLIYWMQRLPQVQFTNLYGPTEATIASSYYTIPECPRDERAPIPIGTACAGEELLVLNEHLQPVPGGTTGQLYIRGVGLSPGYWKDRQKTREVFLPNPQGSMLSDRLYKTGDLARFSDDGLVYFLGRTDSQIKSRGYRIELGEIETALNAMEILRECAVLAIPGSGFNGATIYCAYVPCDGIDLGPARLRSELEKALPHYMIPSRWTSFRHLPKNANGKIDRRRLREILQPDAAAATEHA
jgi:amino acid adenylation domain-containing protein